MLERIIGELFFEGLSNPRASTVAFGTNVTVDSKITLNSESEIKEVVTRYLTEYSDQLSETDKKILRTIQDEGLKSDAELSSVPSDIIEKEREINKERINESIGGSPAISAIYGSKLHLISNGFKNIGKMSYFGNLTRSVVEFIQNYPEFDPSERDNLLLLFSQGTLNENRSRTVSYEFGKHKLMIAFEKGRNLSDLKTTKGDFQIHLPDEIPGENLLIGIGGLNKGSPLEYRLLLDQLNQIRPNSYSFIGTNSFKREIARKDRSTLLGYLEVLRNADIVSMNEAELDQIYAVESLGENHMTRQEKLEHLKFKGLSIVHSPEGIIFRLGNNITEDAKGLIEAVLKISGDLCTMNYKTGSFPRSADEINEFRTSIIRSYLEHKNTFYGNNNQMPINPKIDDPYRFGYVISPYIDSKSAFGKITGLGATLDGYVSSMLAPVIHLCKK